MTINENDNYETQVGLLQLLDQATNTKVEEIAPDFRRKNNISDEQLEKIIKIIQTHLGMKRTTQVIVGMNLLFLQGAASAGAPITMSVNLGEGICMEKRNIVDACNTVTGHKFIRRIAETLAPQIGRFAYNNKLVGELGYRINNKLKAEKGESLSELELAYCSSFSQVIPNLNEITSERLSKLLAEDYQIRFEKQKKSKPAEGNTNGKKDGPGKKRRR